jgi:hypothetical protein
MGRSVAEVRRVLEETQHKMAIWDRVVDYLSSFVDTEAREARNEIKLTKDSPAVPQELVSSIIQGIEAEKISPLREEIKTLENLPVVEAKDGNHPQGERPETRAKANSKRVRIVAKPG